MCDFCVSGEWSEWFMCDLCVSGEWFMCDFLYYFNISLYYIYS